MQYEYPLTNEELAHAIHYARSHSGNNTETQRMFTTHLAELLQIQAKRASWTPAQVRKPSIPFREGSTRGNIK